MSILDVFRKMYQRWQEGRERWEAEQQRQKELGDAVEKDLQELWLRESRKEELRVNMDRLISEHMVVNSLEEFYSYIPTYVDHLAAWEYDYCKDYMKKKVQRGYYRYDEERLR